MVTSTTVFFDIYRLVKSPSRVYQSLVEWKRWSSIKVCEVVLYNQIQAFFLSILGYALSGWRKLYYKRCFLFNYPKRLNEILFFNYERSTVKSFLTFVLKRESLDNLVVLQSKISHKLIVLTIKKMHVFRLSKIGICPLNPGFLARNNLIYFDEILPLQRCNSKL